MKNLITIVCLMSCNLVSAEITFRYAGKICSFSGDYYEITDKTIMAFDSNFTKRDFVTYYHTIVKCGEETNELFCSKGAIGDFKPLECATETFSRFFVIREPRGVIAYNANLDVSNGICFISKNPDSLEEFHFCKPLNKETCPKYDDCHIASHLVVNKLRYQ